MDGSATEIVLDEEGVCNFCHQAMQALQDIYVEKKNLQKILGQIQYDGMGRKYDVLIGLSGGADSSTVLHQAKKLGLRPLCYTIDNGWNDPKADENIMRLVEGLKVPFYRLTIDINNFQDLQGSFIKAGVPNIEIPTDHILMASALEMASQYGIKWILSGGNVSTESIMPASWGYSARDLVHLKAIHKKFGRKPLKGFPTCSLLKWNYYRWIKKIKTIYLLDYLDYNRKDAIKLLADKYGWQDYYEKHCESLYTWWFQNYYLFEKFGIDKRKTHYAALINSGQMTRKESFDLLAGNPVYPDLGVITQKAMKYPKGSHDDYPKDKYELISKIVRKFI